MLRHADPLAAEAFVASRFDADWGAVAGISAGLGRGADEARLLEMAWRPEPDPSVPAAGTPGPAARPQRAAAAPCAITTTTTTTTTSTTDGRHSLNLVAMLEATVRNQPHWPALRYEGATLSYRDFNAMTRRAATVLQGRGVTRGSRVALMCTNTPGFLVAMFGALRLCGGGAGQPQAAGGGSGLHPRA